MAPVAEALGRMQQWAEFNQIVGALAGTREAKLTAPAAQARARGQAYDPERALLFESLYAALQQNPAAARSPAPRDGIGSATLAFFEACFSNYIEGTEFEVEEAANIVFRGHIPHQRLADAHDILGVWRIVSDPSEMRRAPKTPDELIEILRDRHAIAMQANASGRIGHLLFQPVQGHQPREQFLHHVLGFLLRNRPPPQEKAQDPDMLVKQLLDQLPSPHASTANPHSRSTMSMISGSIRWVFLR